MQVLKNSQIKISQLTRRKKDKTILHDINLQISSGEMVAIIGPNGAGKSTLLKEMAGFSLPLNKEDMATGESVFMMPGGQTIKASQMIGMQNQSHASAESTLKLSYIPQFDYCHWNLSVYEVMYISANHLIKDPRQRDAAIEQIAGKLNIRHLFEQKYLTLSGGQRARVILARSMVHSPDWMFADEPVASLDIRYQHEVLRLLKNYTLHFKSDTPQINSKDNAGGQNTTETNMRSMFQPGCVLILHDLNLAYQYCQQAILMKDGQCYDYGNIDNMFSERKLSEVFDVPVVRRTIEANNNVSKVIFSDNIAH